MRSSIGKWARSARVTECQSARGGGRRYKRACSSDRIGGREFGSELTRIPGLKTRHYISGEWTGGEARALPGSLHCVTCPAVGRPGARKPRAR
jgi:hypothetical protein